MNSSDHIESVLSRLDARINWERRDRSGGWRISLSPMEALVEALGRPDRAYEIVHVTGSKGKGSTSSFIAAGLRASGARVGVYSSPHVERIHERIVIDGAPIDSDAFVAALEQVLDCVEGAPEDSAIADASWFDLVTATGMVAFRNAGVDWAVLEVGLGGRLDSTNVIDVPRAAVITMIALEHANVLGGTKDAIAREKGGIIKRAGVCLTGCAEGSEEGDALAQIAAERGASLTFMPLDECETLEGRNVALARATLEAMGKDSGLLDDDAIRAARLPGRMESREFGSLRVLLDGAHVRDSVAAAFAEGVARFGDNVIAVTAVHKEKDAARVLEALAACRELVLTTVPGSGVHLTATELHDATQELFTGRPVVIEEDPVEGLRLACDRAAVLADGSPDDAPWVFVTGSLYLVGALRALTSTLANSDVPCLRAQPASLKKAGSRRR